VGTGLTGGVGLGIGVGDRVGGAVGARIGSSIGAGVDALSFVTKGSPGDWSGDVEVETCPVAEAVAEADAGKA
jgi:hypothetical protein